MLIYLAKKATVTFAGAVSQSNGTVYRRTSSVPVTLIPADVNDEDQIRKLEKKLDRYLASETNTSEWSADWVDAGPWNIEVEMGFYTPTTTPGCPGNVSNSSSVKGFIRVADTGAKGILEGLSQVYGKGKPKLTVQIENVKYVNPDPCKTATMQNVRRLPQPYYNAIGNQQFRSRCPAAHTLRMLGDPVCSASEVRALQPNLQGCVTPQLMNIIEENVDITSKNVFGVEKSGLDVKGEISVNQWTQKQHYGGRWEVCLTIIAVVPDEYTDIDSSVTDKLCTIKKLLMEQVCSDATIIANNGVSVKCHKAFLAVNSSVLATMFQTAMLESQTNNVTMPDMSEASVRALLAYLYCWETKEAANNCLICFELFAAGHKYDIRQLEGCMEKILLLKNSDWYDVDVAMKLFLFSRKLGSGERLKMKAIQVLKTKFSDLRNSPCYKELFKEDPEAAMDLCEYAFSV